MTPCRTLFALLAAVGSAAAQNAAEVGITDFSAGYGVGPGAGMTLKLGHYVPVTVYFEVRNGSFRGEFEVVAPDSDGNDVVHIIPNVFVAENVNRVSATAVGLVKIGKDNPTIHVRAFAVDESGRRTQRANRTFPLGNANRQLEVISNTDELVGLVGEVGGAYEMKDLVSDNNNMRMQFGGNPPRAVRFRSERDMPLQWTGYTGLDWMVIATSDEKLFDRLDPQRASAIRTWVRQGGRLVVCAAKNWQIVSKSFLAPMLPAELVGVDEIEFAKTPINAALESFAGGKQRMETTKRPKFALAKLGKLSTPGKLQVQHAGRPLAYSAAYGLGQVTLVAFDAGEAPFVNWTDAKLFWAKLMKLHIPTDNMNQRYYNANDESRALSDRMEDFPDVTVVPFHWVALLIFGYILLIGPIDYFFLKKVVKRLELTWITFPTWVLLISVGAYFSAYFLKGDVLRVNRLEIVDVDAATNTLRGTAYACVFSPRIHSYDLAFTPALGADGAWSQLAASRTGAAEAGAMGEDQLVGLASWHGIPEDTGLRGMGDGGSGILGRREYGAKNYLGGSVVGVQQAPIQVWSTKTFTGSWLAKAKPVVEAKFTVDGFKLRGTIKNLLDTPLDSAMLVYEQSVWRIPQLLPNLEVDLASVNARNLSDVVKGTVAEQQYYPGRYQQTAGKFADVESLLRSLLFYRARGEVGRGRSTANVYLGQLDLTHQLELGRVAMFARLAGDKPAAGGKLWLEEPPTAADPKPVDGSVKNQTYLRVVFDPVKETP